MDIKIDSYVTYVTHILYLQCLIAAITFTNVIADGTNIL